MDNYEFIVAQIADLQSEGCSMADSTFVKTLIKMRETRNAKREKDKKHKEDVEKRRIIREKDRDERRRKKEEELKQKRAAREALLAIRRAKKLEAQKYPMEDLKLLEEIKENGGTIQPMPTPVDANLAPAGVLGDIIMVWQLLSTFETSIELPHISLESLCDALQYSEGELVLINQLFTTLMRPILKEREFQNHHIAVASDYVKFGAKYVRAYGIEELELGDLFNEVTWAEILRQMMARDAGIVSSIGYVEPLSGCEALLRKLQLQHNAVPFNSPVDLNVFEDYMDIVKVPMDLSTVADRLRAGYYEENTQGSDIAAYTLFAQEVQMIWDNAILYNGEDSVLGKSALAFSDFFEQEFKSLVVSRVNLNKTSMEKRTTMKQLLDAATPENEFTNSISVSVSDAVTALAVKDFHEVRSMGDERFSSKLINFLISSRLA